MLLQAILLFIATLPASFAEETPLMQTLPDKQFTASSVYNSTFKASDVRFGGSDRVSSREPWCPATRDDYDYSKEYVTVDLGCPRTIESVVGTDPYLLFYSSEYSNDNRRWKKLASDDETHYDKNLESFEANVKAVITPQVRARFFRFRTRMYTYSDERGMQPCIKAELYGKPVPEDSVQPMGCFEETKKQPLSLVVYHTVKARVNKKFPDILAIYEECRQKAAEHSKPLEIFGIVNYNKCVTTETGKVEGHFVNAHRSRKCKECFGKGIGAKKTAVFVYKI